MRAQNLGEQLLMGKANSLQLKRYGLTNLQWVHKVDEVVLILSKLLEWLLNHAV